MKRPVKYALIALAGIALVAVLAVAAIIGFFRWSLTHDFIDQSNGPTTRALALKHCGIPLPAGARNVEYASLAGGLQEGDFWVRCEAPVPDCQATAQAIFVKWAADLHRSIPEFKPVSYPPSAGSTRLRTDWFDVDKISKGVAAGNGYGWEPRIWIDEERGIFYYHIPINYSPNSTVRHLLLFMLVCCPDEVVPSATQPVHLIFTPPAP